MALINTNNFAQFIGHLVTKLRRREVSNGAIIYDLFIIANSDSCSDYSTAVPVKTCIAPKPDCGPVFEGILSYLVKGSHVR